MSLRVTACSLFAAFALAEPALAQPTPPVTTVSEAPHQPAGTQRLVVHSTRLGRDFILVVSAPPAAVPIPQGQKLPAVYALDGGYSIVGPVAQMMTWAFAASPAYVVAISYPDDQRAKRDTDLLHRTTTRDGQTVGGGGAAFQAFLMQDLRPYLEARYPLDPGKAILFGHSYGGLFAATMLAEAPQSFAGYIIASPSASPDPGIATRVAAAAAKGEGRRVYVGAGALETANDMVANAGRIADALSAPGSTFKTAKHVFEGGNHISYYPRLVPEALAWVLPTSAAAPVTRKAIAVSPDALERLVGVYAIGGGRVITVTRKDAALIVGMTGYPGGEVLAETPTRFFVQGLDVTVTFEGPADGLATAVVVRISGADIRGVRQ